VSWNGRRGLKGESEQWEILDSFVEKGTVVVTVECEMPVGRSSRSHARDGKRCGEGWLTVACPGEGYLESGRGDTIP